METPTLTYAIVNTDIVDAIKTALNWSEDMILTEKQHLKSGKLGLSFFSFAYLWGRGTQGRW